MALDGLLLVDKPPDMTSHDVVARVRHNLKQKTVGHTGTLDPLATGLLVLVLGDATKLSDYLVSADKQYQLTVKLGLTTDTLDRTGQVLTTHEGALPSADRLEEACESLQGDFDWPVPLFSAVKVDGKKMYEHGRKGETVDLPVKSMSFWGLETISRSENTITSSLFCSKGSFIRTWASQLGSLLGVGGVIEELRRLRVGQWDVANAVTLRDLEMNGLPSCLELKTNAFVPMAQALPGLKSVMANPKEARLMGNGQIPRDMMSRLVPEQKQAYDQNKSVFVKVLANNGDLLALLAAEPGQGLKIKRVFRTLS